MKHALTLRAAEHEIGDRNAEGSSEPPQGTYARNDQPSFELGQITFAEARLRDERREGLRSFTS
jgi:hypothetical protein